MPVIIPMLGRLVFKMDTGEMKGGKPVYITVSVRGVLASASDSGVIQLVTALEKTLPLMLEEVTLTRPNRVKL